VEGVASDGHSYSDHRAAKPGRCLRDFAVPESNGARVFAKEAAEPSTQEANGFKEFWIAGSLHRSLMN